MKIYIYHGKEFQFVDGKVPKGAIMINEEAGKVAQPEEPEAAEKVAQPEEPEAAKKDKKNKEKGVQTK